MASVKALANIVLDHLDMVAAHWNGADDSFNYEQAYEITQKISSQAALEHSEFMAAINFAADDALCGSEFLRLWSEGCWPEIRKEFPEFKGPFPRERHNEGGCCGAEDRGMTGGCRNCGDPSY